uniref:Uncharacterized protein n=1 Tax=Knipowitschia caucasica TaxID=637954 RepID=A0AAV2KMK1_KNICA
MHHFFYSPRSVVEASVSGSSRQPGSILTGKQQKCSNHSSASAFDRIQPVMNEAKEDCGFVHLQLVERHREVDINPTVTYPLSSARTQYMTPALQ